MLKYISVVYLAIQICLGIQSSSWIKTKRFAGWSITESNGIETSALRMFDCLFQCAHSTTMNCNAIYYNGTGTVCRHYNDTVHVKTGDDNDVLILTPLATGSAMIVNKEWTFSEATDTCLVLGGHLMSYSEMVEAYTNKKGLDLCGWNSDGIQRQIYNDASTVSKGVDDCYQNSRRRAWCKIDAF